MVTEIVIACVFAIKIIGCKVEALVNHEAEAFGNHKAEARLPKI